MWATIVVPSVDKGGSFSGEGAVPSLKQILSFSNMMHSATKNVTVIERRQPLWPQCLLNTCSVLLVVGACLDLVFSVE